jgi:predicted Rossmann fold flavoprotein
MFLITLKVTRTDTIIIGAGAAGLMCAMTAGQHGRKVIILEHAEKPGKKILISGGGRCNFTNIYASHENFISDNPHFCKSALAGYTPDDFIQLVTKHGINFHEKKLGQLFCDGSAKQIVEMLLKECGNSDVKLNCSERVVSISKDENFLITTNKDQYLSESVVIATGGMSIPKMGATGFGYDVARQFGHRITRTKPGLVPFLLPEKERKRFSEISGVSADTVVSIDKMYFRENTLFTHRGLSGPAMLQASSYWNEGKVLRVNFLPDTDLVSVLEENRSSKITLGNLLSGLLPQRLVSVIVPEKVTAKTLNQISNAELNEVVLTFHDCSFYPSRTEGFEKAEVTCGGVDTRELSSKTMESTKVKGLFFIGEVVDVTGWLGGYNFQWAWASGYAAGRELGIKN